MKPKYIQIRQYMRPGWFITCFVLLSYQTWKCVDQYLQFHTVSRTSLERQELHDFPMICLASENFPAEYVKSLNTTKRRYLAGETWRTKQMNEEEMYNRLSFEFHDLVKTVRIDKTKKENSESYEKVYFEAKDIANSGIDVLRLDYYHELKRYCLKFPLQLFPHGIQTVRFYMKSGADKVVFFLVPPGGFFAQARKRNHFRFLGGIAVYNIEYSLYYSLSLPNDPCYKKAAWKEDDCKLGIINSMIMETFNCTTPWLLHFARSCIELDC